MSDQSSKPSAGAFALQERVEECDVCGGRGFSMVDAAADIIECDACDYRFVNPRPSQSEIAAAYSNPDFYDGWIRDEAGRSQLWRKRLKLLRKKTRGNRVLDLGAGVGSFLALARDEGWRVVGTEVSASACDIARERYGLELLLGRAEELSLPPRAFDVVTLWHVLEHVPSPSRLLRVCREALIPGGSLVVAVPNDAEVARFPSKLKQRVLRLTGRHPQPKQRYERLAPGSEIHLSHFTLSVLRRLLAKEGFVVRWVSVDDHYPRPSWRTDARVLCYRAIRRLSGVQLGQAMVIVATIDAAEH